jgi:hypothetical protein
MKHVAALCCILLRLIRIISQEAVVGLKVWKEQGFHEGEISHIETKNIPFLLCLTIYISH